jgi:uncharacterized protein (DUF427 family)
MAIDLLVQKLQQLGELRYVATSKRIRAALDGATVVDTTAAYLVCEPKRIVPMYAVPEAELKLELVARDPMAPPDEVGPVIPPLHLDWHTTPGRSLHLGDRGEVAFRPDDPALGGRVILPWDRFEWTEEEEPVVVHPHDPFSRIDILPSSRHVRVDVAGTTVAESTRPTALYETGLATRWYLPREDIRMDLLSPSDFRTGCAYKGFASYFSAEGAPDVAWTYPDPLREVLPIKDMLSFWRAADVYVDGERVPTGMPGED